MTSIGGDLCAAFCSICCICCSSPGMTNLFLMKSGSRTCCGKKLDDDEFEQEEARLEAQLKMQGDAQHEAAADEGNVRRSSVDRQPNRRETMRLEIRQDS